MAKFIELTNNDGGKFLVNSDSISMVFRSLPSSNGLVVATIIDGKESREIRVQEPFDTVKFLLRSAE